MTIADQKAITAHINRIREGTDDEWQTLHIEIPDGQQWEIGGRSGYALFTLYRPTDADLQAIGLACEGELNRRQDARIASIAAQEEAETQVPA